MIIIMLKILYIYIYILYIWDELGVIQVIHGSTMGPIRPTDPSMDPALPSEAWGITCGLSIVKSLLRHYLDSCGGFLKWGS